MPGNQLRLYVLTFLLLLSMLPGVSSASISNDNTNVNDVSNPGGTTSTVATSDTTVDTTDGATTVTNENVNINRIGNTGGGNTNTDTTGTTSGDAVCKQPCGIYASCENGVCQCPADRPIGDAKFHCRPAGAIGCFAFGDPKVLGFSGGDTRIKLPCKTTMAQFDTQLGQSAALGAVSDTSGQFSKSDPPNGKCRFVVQSTTKVSPHKALYYTHSVDMRIVINRMNTPHNVWIHLEDGNYYYILNGGAQVPLAAGQCHEVTLRERTVSICDDTTAGMWNVYVGACGRTEVMFRPWDTSKSNQHNTVGMGITQQTQGDFRHPESQYPYSFCHIPDGNDKVYHEYKAKSGTDSKYAGSLYAGLRYAPEQDQTDDLCEKLTDMTFPDCPTTSQAPAVSTCGIILLDRATCALLNDGNPLEAFENCMMGVCSDDSILCRTAESQIKHETCDVPPTFC